MLEQIGARPTAGPFPGWRHGRPRRPTAGYWARLVVWKLARRRHDPRTVVAKWLFGLRAELQLTSDFGRCVWVAGAFEPNEFALLGDLLGGEDVFVDVGANAGLYSLAAARIVGARGRVLAFEPSRRERELLEANVARNGLANVVVDARAVGASDGDLVVLHVADAEHGGHNTLGSLVYDAVEVVDEQEVTLTTLDTALSEQDRGRVSVVKIDVEGAELGVLAGAEKLLSVRRPVIL
ncbi:MAG TPA: FkbM family methyltransferase, partial [Acidimicrobiales bacterium]|nr:FkbM family methyltransferase [Acidimicrobiales bacterium]